MYIVYCKMINKGTTNYFFNAKDAKGARDAIYFSPRRTRRTTKCWYFPSQWQSLFSHINNKGRLTQRTTAKIVNTIAHCGKHPAAFQFECFFFIDYPYCFGLNNANWIFFNFCHISIWVYTKIRQSKAVDRGDLKQWYFRNHKILKILAFCLPQNRELPYFFLTELFKKIARYQYW